MPLVEALIKPFPALDFIIQIAFLGTMLGTVHSISFWGRRSGYEEFQIVGGWTLVGVSFGLIFQLASITA